MSNSLIEQLKKSGLVDAKKAQQAKKQKHKQNKQKQKQGKQQQVDESKQLALKAQAEKTERDRELNRQKLEEQQKAAITAQIKQLIESNTIAVEEGEIRFNFPDEGKVRRIYVNEILQKQLSTGKLAIVKWDHYVLVPAKVAEKIKERDESYIIFLAIQEAQSDQASDEDDPYADYQIPDDLMW